MVSQKFTISKILVIIIAFLAFVICSLPVRAEGPYTTVYEDNVLYFFKGDFELQYDVNDTYTHSFFEFSTDDVVTFFFVKNRSLYGFFYGMGETFSYTQYDYKLDGSYNQIVINVNNVNGADRGQYTHLFTDLSKFPYVSDTASYYEICREFALSNLLDQFKPTVEVDWLNARSNINYALQNVRGSVADEVFTATWSLPDLMPNAEEYPILVDFTITDLSTNEKSVYAYPAIPDVYGASRFTPYDALELSLSIDLNNIMDLPTDYRVDFVTLTPYYIWVGEYIDLPIFYKGQSSTIYLGYTGHFDFVVQTPPGDPITDVNDEQQTEKGILISIQNFFSGFFSNFGNMLKDLFIPTKEQMQFLFADMENFFSDKLGFLWFPFDLAITIVETFTYGTADSVITVPPISINILGGIDLYGGGQFDMDAVGIFPYVRMITSIVLACGIAGLAYNKWDEWIGGHDK